MKHILKVLPALALSLLISLPALAETLSLSGTVTPSCTHEVYASSSAVVERLSVTLGQLVSADDVIAVLRTTKVYAEQDGTVAAVFGQPGDLTDTVAERYGASLYLEGATTYTVAASTEKAYDSPQTKLVHVGEAVFLCSRSDDSRSGTGVITAVDGSEYTIQVTKGIFEVGESVNVSRDARFSAEQRIGRGSVSASAPIAVTGSGRILSIAVAPGDKVARGDLLMETLTGTGSTREITSGADGVVAVLNAAQGAALEENDVAAVIWPSDAMQVEAPIPESDLSLLHVGDAVTLVFDWNADSGEALAGTVRSIAAASDASSTDTCYTVLIDFVPDASVRYGMNVTVNTLE